MRKKRVLMFFPQQDGVFFAAFMGFYCGILGEILDIPFLNTLPRKRLRRLQMKSRNDGKSDSPFRLRKSSQLGNVPS